ncbi:MAG: spore coat protein [Oscillospiraceae bacterium]|nr:spore coat protein [Oscillospiraceae bacterium]
MMEMKNQSYHEKEMLTDLLASQKFVTGGYNTFANECATPAIKTDFVNILTEEHRLQNEIFCEMHKRGWYQTEAADQNKVNMAKQKYTMASSQ